MTGHGRQGDALSRREWLGALLCGGVAVGAAGWPRVLRAQAAPTARPTATVQLTATPLRPGIALITGAGANLVAAADADGVVMVDGGLEDHAAAVAALVREQFDGRPVRTLFNTHWHPPQSGANGVFADAGARIVAQANTRLWLTTDIRRPWDERVHAPLPPAAQPSLTFHDTGSDIELDGRPLRYGHMLQAHTDGDCYVFFPDANVLAIGGVIAGDRWPEIDWWTGGWLGGLVEGLETLLQIADDDTLIVPSDGPVLRRGDLLAQRDMYETLFVRFRDELLFKGLSPAEAVAARPTAEFHPDWPHRDEFVTLAFQSLWGFFAPDA